ncbi:MAG TPA: hypothetical protein PLH74_04660 [Tenuifilaceae bacterium]|nr:hypothetical protein [Tenuifilaceae bacterium]HPG99341.1 hypothetical protein [Tenuifilaceae bacterium]
MRGKLLMLLVASGVILSVSAYGQNNLPAYLGVSYIPELRWKVYFINHKSIGEPLSLNFDMTSMSSYEGNFGIRRLGVRMGVSAQTENNLIGKFYRWGGYLGFKNMLLRLQSSKMSGDLEWSGALPPGYYANREFSNKYFNIDLLKTAKSGSAFNDVGGYWGVGYTSMGYPVEISTLVTEGGRENQKFGMPAYDTLYSIKSYNICFGFDLLRQLCLTGGLEGFAPGRRAMRFAMYASTQDKVGFGPAKISDYGVSMAEALNPGRTAVTSKFFNVMVHYSLSLGLRYYIHPGPTVVIFALGYDFEGAMNAPFKGAADNAEDLGFDFLNYYLNHGVSFKIYLAWNRDWQQKNQ